MEEEKDTKKKKKKKKGWKLFRIIILSLLSLTILVGVAGLGVALAIIKTSPPLDVNAMLTLNEPSTIYDKDQKYMDDVNTDEKRDIVSIKDIPTYLSKAFVSIEDERFEKHKGIDYQRIIGVIYADIVDTLKGKRGMQGASTITQQLVRNTMLTNVTQEKNFIVSATRKIREMYLALQLEKKLSKDQILEAYINTIPFGSTVHGVQAAATYYFNKPIKEISVAQAAYLAGVPQAPGRFNAFLDSAKKDPTPYLNRTKLVLNAMYKNNVITEEQYNTALGDLSPEKLAFNKPASSSTNRLNYEWFSLPAIEQVKKDLQVQYKYSESEINNLLMYGGLKIYTTMDRSLQDTAQGIINENKNYGISSTILNGIVDPQASAVIMDYNTGEVKVIIGGRGEQPARSINRAAPNGSLANNKPVGSTIKPLTVYSAAIDSKLATAGTVVEDSPVGDEIKKGWNGYDPRNVESSSFSGYVTIREAITRSINLVAVKQEYAIGLKTGASYGEKFGLSLDPKKDQTSLAAMALGELTYGESPLDMAAAYGVFGNNGMYTQPRLYTKVVDRNGLTILESKVVNRKVLSPQANYITYDLLKGPVNSPGGTAGSARIGAMPAAGKTGTTGDKKDLWFAGLTPYYSGAVWIGHDKPKSFGSGISSSTAAAIWGKIMTLANKDLPVKQIERPSGIVSVAICKDSGKLPTDLCSKDPEGDRVYNELFIAGTQPTTLCDIHVEATINKANGKIATENTPQELLEKRVFIKRDYKPSVKLDDEYKVLPTELDDTKPAPLPVPVNPNPSEETNFPGTDTVTSGDNGKGNTKPDSNGEGDKNSSGTKTQ
jgi:penicillin-binding protein 1A